MYQQVNKYVSFELQDNIMVGKYVSGSIIDLDLAQKIVKDRLEFFNGISYPCLVDTTEIISIEFTKEARDYFAKGEGVKGIKALAILTDTLLTLVIGNIFKTFNRPEVPTQIFRNKEGALEWLKGYI